MIETTPEMLNAVQFNKTSLSSVKARVSELMEASTQGDSNNRLFACFWLEAYGVECAGIIPEAPSLVEYLDFKAHLSAVIEENKLNESLF